MSEALVGQIQRLADHLRPVAPAWDRPSGREHMRCLARLAIRAPWPDRAHLVRQAHLARAREAPGRQPPRRACRARQRSSGQRGLQALRRDRGQQHRGSVVRSRREASQTPTRPGRGGSCGTPTTTTPTPPPPAVGVITTANGARAPLHAHFERRPTPVRASPPRTRFPQATAAQPLADSPPAPKPRPRRAGR